MTIKKVVLTDFEGDWTVDRLVVHADGLRARFTGSARWTPVQDGMQFSESGRLKIPGQAPMEASQSYFWDHDLNIWFSDGRFFHTVPAKGGVARHSWSNPVNARSKSSARRAALASSHFCSVAVRPRVGGPAEQPPAKARAVESPMRHNCAHAGIAVAGRPIT